MALPELKSNPLVKRVYKIMDKDSNGNVDLKEFLAAFSQLIEPCRDSTVSVAEG